MTHLADVRDDRQAHVTLGRMALHDGHRWFVFYAGLFFVASVALLAMSGTAMRLMGLAAMLIAVALVTWRVRYWRFVRADDSRLAALGRQRLAAVSDSGVGVASALGSGAGRYFDAASGKGLLKITARM